MIKIDVDTRCWQIPKEEYFLGVESDDKVRILQFEISKNEFYDGLNFTDCNCFINYKNGDNDTIPYRITDMEVQEDGTVTFTWEVSRGATIFKGNTFAVLCAKKVREDGTITNEWNSRIGSFTVAKGLEPSSLIVEVPEIDIISQLLLVAQQTNTNAQTNIDQSSSLLEKAEGLGYLKEDFDVLKARMDQFTSLQEGSTTGDAELIDGRIGYDGKVYDNIGGAIRGQVGELKGDLCELNDTIFDDTFNEKVQTIDSIYMDGPASYGFGIPIGTDYIEQNKEFTLFCKDIMDGEYTCYLTTSPTSSGSYTTVLTFSNGYATQAIEKFYSNTYIRLVKPGTGSSMINANSKLYVLESKDGVFKRIDDVRIRIENIESKNSEQDKNLTNLNSVINDESYPTYKELVTSEYASGPAINVFFIPYSETIKKDVAVTLQYNGYANLEVQVVSVNETKIGTIGTAKKYIADSNGIFTVTPEYAQGYAGTTYLRILSFSHNPSTNDCIYELVDKVGITKRIDILEEDIVKLDERIDNLGEDIVVSKYEINNITDKKIAHSKGKDLKLLFMSDTHLGVELQSSLNDRYGYTDEERMNLLVDAIRKENELSSIDMVFFLGDMVSNQVKKDSTTHKDEDFIPVFIKKMNEFQLPYMCCVGNHELYTDEMFNDVFGYPSNYIVEIKGYSIIVLNMFTVENTTNPSSSGMGGSDISSELKDNIINYLNNTENENAIVCCHGFNSGVTYTNYSELMSHSKVKFGVFGHAHDLANPSTVGNKPVWNDGNFSINVEGTSKWSYRIFENNSNFCGTYAVQPSETYTIDGEIIEFERTEGFSKTWNDTRVDYGIKIIKA